MTGTPYRLSRTAPPIPDRLIRHDGDRWDRRWAPCLSYGWLYQRRAWGHAV